MRPVKMTTALIKKTTMRGMKKICRQSQNIRHTLSGVQTLPEVEGVVVVVVREEAGVKGPKGHNFSRKNIPMKSLNLRYGNCSRRHMLLIHRITRGQALRTDRAEVVVVEGEHVEDKSTEGEGHNPGVALIEGEGEGNQT